MDILSEEQHRALAFISAVNAGGYLPLEENVEKWLSDPSPGLIPGATIGYAMMSAMNALRSVGWHRGKSVTSHLVDLEWAAKDPSGRISLTQLGEALLRNANTQEVEGAQMVVLDNEDPLAYATLMGELAEIREALLVDPYLDVDGVFNIVQHTDITRALIRAESNTRRNRSAIATFLNGAEDPRLEVRVAKGLHDRFIVADDGHVWTIGASINGVAKRKSVTVFSPMPESAAQILSEQLERTWAEAQPLPSDTDTEES